MGCYKRIKVKERPSQHQSFMVLNNYQPKGGDALRLGSKGRYSSYVGGR